MADYSHGRARIPILSTGVSNSPASVLNWSVLPYDVSAFGVCMYVKCPTKPDVETVSCPTKPDSGKTEINPKSYGRVPASIVYDRRLSSYDIRVYASLAIDERSGVSKSSGRFGADALAMNKDTFYASIQKLLQLNHIERKAGTGVNGVPSHYALRSIVFGNAGPVVSTPSAKKRPTLLKCAECHKPRVLGKAGWCKACAAKHDRIRETEGVVMRMVGGMVA